MATRDAANGAAMNLRMATMHMAGINVPPRVRAVPNVRRRLPVTIISEPPKEVIIRQAAPKIDTNVNETRQNQSPRA
jgi:hypothetical protein